MPQETTNPANLKIRFESRHFAIERAQLWLYRIQSGIHVKTLTTTTGQAIEPGDFNPLGVVNGSVDAIVDRPCHVEGALFEIRTRRPSGGTALLGLAQFSHDITEQDWRSGLTTINMDAYREVAIKVRDREGRPVGRVVLGLAGGAREGGIDLTVDEKGEARLLLSPGNYGGGYPGGPRVRFEITEGDGDDILEVIVPTQP